MKKILLGLSIILVFCVRLRAGELVVNGGFESGNFSGGWVHGAGNTRGQYDPAWADHLVVLDCPYSGNYSALLGFKYTSQSANRFGYMYQDVAIPSNISRATLYFKFRQQGYDGLQYDPFIVEIRNPANNSLLRTVLNFAFSEWNYQFKDSGWLDDDNSGPVGHDVTSFAGRTVRLLFRQYNLYDNLYETWAFIDHVSLMYKKFVDLAVDGNGDDVFGSPGSGDGGIAIRSTLAARTVVYSLDIENEGLDQDSYSLGASAPSGWTVRLRYNGELYSFPWTTPALPAGARISAEVLVDVPAGQSTGGYSTIVDAVSESFSNRYDSARLVTNVVPTIHGTDLTIDSNGFGIVDPNGGGGISFAEVDLDTRVTYELELFNTGYATDSFRVNFTTSSPLSAEVIDGGVIRDRQFVTAPIAARDSSAFSLRVTVPAFLPGGDYFSFVYATSLTDTLRKDGVKAVTRVRAPKVDAVICGSGKGIIDATGAGLGGSATVAGRRSITVYLPFQLLNEGAVADSFDISWTAPAAGWSALVLDEETPHSLPWITPTMKAFSERNYILAITIAANAGYDTYRSILSFVSMSSPNIRESVSANVAVATSNEVDLTIEGNGQNVYGAIGSGLGGSAIKTASPGDIVTFAIFVENESGEDLFDLSWTSLEGWVVSIGDSTSGMRRVAGGAYTLKIAIPSTCLGGTYDIILDALKTNKRFLVDSVRGRLIVSKPHRVDALIDSNGDGLFGAPGSGAGGSSFQSTIGGRKVRFTLELQNQGAEQESFIVTWNGYAGWTATLAGAGSPFSSSPIDPGASSLYDFEVMVPSSATPGDYPFILDIFSTLDPDNFESVRAQVHVNHPPKADLVIEGKGAWVTAPAGTGAGGSALIFGDPGSVTTARLDLVNRGGFPDSFRVSWKVPEGWPLESVWLWDGSTNRTEAFNTAIIQPGDSLTLTVFVNVHSEAGVRIGFILDAVGISRELEDSVTLEICTAAFLTGSVFDDIDHDGALDIGERGWAGVMIALFQGTYLGSAITDGYGRYIFEVPPPGPFELIELTPSGMLSLSSDSVSTGTVAAGETIRVDFADVRISTISPSNYIAAVAGGFVDAAHTVVAGTPGQASILMDKPAGWIALAVLDRDGDGRWSKADTILSDPDLQLDPSIEGRDVVPLVIRLFVPPQVPIGEIATVEVKLVQTLSGTALNTESHVFDEVHVIARASGFLVLSKSVDFDRARPGDVLTYTIDFTNPGVEAVQEIEIIDPISPSVEIVHDAFGEGFDIEWVRGGVPVYLTAASEDSDEALYEDSERTLRLVLSRRTQYLLGSGERGSIVYRVRIR